MIAKLCEVSVNLKISFKKVFFTENLTQFIVVSELKRQNLARFIARVLMK